MSARVFAADGFRTDVTAPDTSGARAAPAGGAWKRGRGCCASLSIIATVVSFGAGVCAEPVETGSGVVYQFHDIIDEAPTYRLRFVVAGLGGEGLTYGDLADDFGLICAGFALPRLSESEADPERVVIALMSKPIDFGAIDPDTTQFFESFTVENDSCIWEAF